jgi:hypothetical protein
MNPATIQAISYKIGVGVWSEDPRSEIQLSHNVYPSGSKRAATITPINNSDRYTPITNIEEILTILKFVTKL